ncbi:hypothetical protein F4814DRAFT_444343 [Daldinia grandis]|nr:hypothetical protein F4814DRAFT_444343 [Daldinia grandis]
MEYLRGSSHIEVLAFEVEMDPDEEVTHKVFVKDLACPQSADRQPQAEQQEGFCKRLAQLLKESPSILSNSVISKLIEDLPRLFNQYYPQVLTHEDFKLEITGIVDQSLTAVMPFGMDLDILFSSIGYMARNGWHDYACKLLLQDVFWAMSGLEGDEHRDKTRGLAETASKIGAILRLAFQRNADGSPSEEVLVSESKTKQPRAWFGEQAAKLV